jgi:hypothetical protein
VENEDEKIRVRWSCCLLGLFSKLYLFLFDFHKMNGEGQTTIELINFTILKTSVSKLLKILPLIYIVVAASTKSAMDPRK